MSKLSRTKGHGFEREVARAFVAAGYDGARRQLEYHINDAQGVDLQGTGSWRVQCKRGRKYANPNKIEEIKDLTGKPVLVTRADDKPALAVMRLEDFLALIDIKGRAHE